MSIKVLSREQIIEACRAAPMSMLGTTADREALIKTSQDLADGYYVCDCHWLAAVLEGPHADEAYARHRAVTVHGMTDPTAEPDTSPEETGQDDLPW